MGAKSFLSATPHHSSLSTHHSPLKEVRGEEEVVSSEKSIVGLWTEMMLERHATIRFCTEFREPGFAQWTAGMRSAE